MQWLAEVSRWLEEKRLENDQASDWLVGALTVVSDHLQEVLCNATHPLGEKVVEFTRRQSVQLKEIESSDLTSLVELIITFAMALHSLVIQRFKLLNSCAELTTAVYFPIHRVLLEPLYIPLYKLHSQECKHKDAEWSAAVVALHAVGPQELGVSAKFCFDAVSVKSASQPRPRRASTEGIINEACQLIKDLEAKSGWSSTCKKLQELVASVEGMQRTAECEIAECDEHTRVDMLWQALREAQISGAAQERHACGVFLPAVQCIRQMPCARSGLDKALCIKHAMTAVYRVIAEQQMGGSEMTTRSAAIGADDVLPLLCYITLQAAVPCLETEITIMESLLPEELQMGELGYEGWGRGPGRSA